MPSESSYNHSTLIPPILQKGDYIYGTFLKPEVTNGYIKNSNPAYSTETLGNYSFSFSSIPQAIAYANAIHMHWKNRSIQTRMEPILRFQQDIAKNHTYLTKMISIDCGYPLSEASMELNDCIRFLQFLLESAPRLLADIEQKKHTQKLIPFGCVALLTPHVHSFFHSVVFSASALLAGNVVIHKPSRYTPAIGQMIAEIWDRCNLKRGVYNMVQGPGTHISQHLLKSPDIHALVCAGEYQTTHYLNKKLPFHIPKILFGGGKGSAIVLDSADIVYTANCIVQGAIRAGGQSPYGISHVFVEKGIAAPLVEQIILAMSSLIITPSGQNPPSMMGPLISEHAHQQYMQQQDQIESYGHKKWPYEVSLAEEGFFVAPCLFEINTNKENLVLDEEIHGPIIVLYEMADCNSSIKYAAKRSFRRSISLFIDPNDDLLENILPQMPAGTTHINQLPSLPITSTAVHGKCANGAREGLGILRSLVEHMTIPKPEIF